MRSLPGPCCITCQKVKRRPEIGGRAVRSFRFYEKKRGHRRTGSSKLGRAGELIASLCLVVAGGLFLYFIAKNWFLPAWRVSHGFVETTCTVLDRRVGETSHGDVTLYRPEVRIEYRVAGTPYRIWTYPVPTLQGPLAQGKGQADSLYSPGRTDKQEIINQFIVNREYYCWYDPQAPEVAVLLRGFYWGVWLSLIVPVSFVILGGVGVAHSLLYATTSAERRAALARRAGRLDPFDDANAAELPKIPDDATITDSPGTTLAYRLPIRTSPAWMLVLLGSACVIWNVLVVVSAGYAINNHLEGRPDWVLPVFLIPFVLVGVGMMVYFVYRVLVANGIGPTLIEISDHPLIPGHSYQVFVSQSGRLQLRSFSVRLVCEEEATYRQGTDIRVQRCLVHDQELIRREALEIHRGTPFEMQCELCVPDTAMHSFRANHNEIRWKLLVDGRLRRWAGYQRDFAVIVHPPTGQEQA